MRRLQRVRPHTSIYIIQKARWRRVRLRVMCFESVAVSFKNCNELHLRQRLRPTVYKPQISEIQIAPVKPELDAAIVGQKAQLTESADIQVGVGRLAELPTPEGSISPVAPLWWWRMEIFSLRSAAAFQPYWCCKQLRLRKKLAY